MLMCMKQTKRNWIKHVLAAPEKRAMCANVHEASKQKWIEHMLVAHEKRPQCIRSGVRVERRDMGEKACERSSTMGAEGSKACERCGICSWHWQLWVLIFIFSLGDMENVFWEEVGLGHYESRKTSDSIKSDIGNEQMHTF